MESMGDGDRTIRLSDALDAEKQFQLGDALHKQGRGLEAIPHYALAAASDPHQFGSYLHAIGQAYWMASLPFAGRGDEERAVFESLASKAEFFLSRAVEQSPDFFRARVDLGEVLWALKDYSGAMVHFRWLDEEDPGNPKYLSFLASCLYNTGRFASAGRTARKALASTDLGDRDPDTTLAVKVLTDLDDARAVD